MNDRHTEKRGPTAQLFRKVVAPSLRNLKLDCHPHHHNVQLHADFYPATGHCRLGPVVGHYGRPQTHPSEKKRHGLLPKIVQNDAEVPRAEMINSLGSGPYSSLSQTKELPLLTVRSNDKGITLLPRHAARRSISKSSQYRYLGNTKTAKSFSGGGDAPRSEQEQRFLEEQQTLDHTRHLKRVSEIATHQHRVDRMYYMCGSQVALKGKYDVDKDALERLRAASLARPHSRSSRSAHSRSGYSRYSSTSRDVIEGEVTIDLLTGAISANSSDQNEKIIGVLESDRTTRNAVEQERLSGDNVNLSGTSATDDHKGILDSQEMDSSHQLLASENDDSKVDDHLSNSNEPTDGNDFREVNTFVTQKYLEESTHDNPTDDKSVSGDNISNRCTGSLQIANDGINESSSPGEEGLNGLDAGSDGVNGQGDATHGSQNGAVDGMDINGEAIVLVEKMVSKGLSGNIPCGKGDELSGFQEVLATHDMDMVTEMRKSVDGQNGDVISNGDCYSDREVDGEQGATEQLGASLSEDVKGKEENQEKIGFGIVLDSTPYNATKQEIYSNASFENPALKQFEDLAMLSSTTNQSGYDCQHLSSQSQRSDDQESYVTDTSDTLIAELEKGVQSKDRLCKNLDQVGRLRDSEVSVALAGDRNGQNDRQTEWDDGVYGKVLNDEERKERDELIARRKKKREERQERKTQEDGGNGRSTDVKTKMNLADVYSFITARQRMIFQRKFQELDVDGNGKVTLTELTKKMEKTATKDSLKELVKVFDLNKDKTIDQREFVTVAALNDQLQGQEIESETAPLQLNLRKLGLHITAYKEIFELVDKDNSGHLTVDEIMFIISVSVGADIGTDKEIVDYIFKTVDVDGDGSIDFVEFLSFIPFFLKLHREMIGRPASFEDVVAANKAVKEALLRKRAAGGPFNY